MRAIDALVPLRETKEETMGKKIQPVDEIVEIELSDGRVVVVCEDTPSVRESLELLFADL